jgi:hypothetical protein
MNDEAMGGRLGRAALASRCGRVSFLTTTSFGETAGRLSEESGQTAASFHLLFLFCLCCCCVCNTKIPQTIDLSSLLDNPQSQTLFGIKGSLGFLHFNMGIDQKEMAINIKKKTYLSFSLFFVVTV